MRFSIVSVGGHESTSDLTRSPGGRISDHQGKILLWWARDVLTRSTAEQRKIGMSSPYVLSPGEKKRAALTYYITIVPNAPQKGLRTAFGFPRSFGVRSVSYARLEHVNPFWRKLSQVIVAGISSITIGEHSRSRMATLWLHYVASQGTL